MQKLKKISPFFVFCMFLTMALCPVLPGFAMMRYIYALHQKPWKRMPYNLDVKIHFFYTYLSPNATSKFSILISVDLFPPPLSSILSSFLLVAWLAVAVIKLKYKD